MARTGVMDPRTAQDRRESTALWQTLPASRAEFASGQLASLVEQLAALDALLVRLDPIQSMAVLVVTETALASLTGMTTALRAVLEPATQTAADPVRTAD